MANSVELTDVQGLVRFGFNHLTEACYLLLHIRDAAPATAWLAGVLPLITTAVKLPVKPTTAVQVAFTASGLRKLGLSKETLGGFSAEFLQGMAGSEDRSRRLGDLGASAPESWEWGRPGSEPHALIILMAAPGLLEGQLRIAESGAFGAGFEIIACLPTSDMHSHEPFGFRDGISQPEIDWQQRQRGGDTVLRFTNVVTLGEVLLGYPNSYGKYTDRPLLDPSEETTCLPFAEDQSTKKDLGRNGTYLVLRQLEQDVRAFWKFADRSADSDPAERTRLAEAMVGRKLGGDPLVPLLSAEIPGIADHPNSPPNRFTYDLDPSGIQCPFGAHVRRANPRNVDLPGDPQWFLPQWLRMLGYGIRSFRDDALASTRFHRVIRRGREYGPALSINDALELPPKDDNKRGLHFVCLNANISRQFEFVQAAWLMNPAFDGLSDEADALLGNRTGVGNCPSTGTYSIPREGSPARVLSGVPQFVTVRGGAYFFLPSLNALRYFCQGQLKLDALR